MSDVFREHAVTSDLAILAAELLGEPVSVLTSLLFNKPAYCGEGLAPHQDLPYYGYLSDQDLITAWTALDDVDEHNGCINYLPGSHCSRVAHQQTNSQQALDIPLRQVDVRAMVAVPLTRGESVFHHGLTVHSSAANRSGRPRMGLATLFVPSRVSISEHDFPYPVLYPHAWTT